MKASGNNLEEIGSRMKAARNFLGLTQESLANAVGGSKRGIQDNEARNRVPGGEVVAGFIGLGINPVWLLTGEGEMLLNKGVTLDDAISGRTAARLAAGLELNVAKRLAEGFAPNSAVLEFAEKMSGSTAAHLVNELARPAVDAAHTHYRIAEPEAHYHSRDQAILRMAITLAEEAAAVQSLSVDQRVELILTFYNRLSKQSEK